jgi:hypothetical protein
MKPPPLTWKKSKKGIVFRYQKKAGSFMSLLSFDTLGHVIARYEANRLKGAH